MSGRQDCECNKCNKQLQPSTIHVATHSRSWSVQAACLLNIMWMGCWNIRREISQTPATLQKCVMCYYCRITLHWSGRNEADMIRLWCIEQAWAVIGGERVTWSRYSPLIGCCVCSRTCCAAHVLRAADWCRGLVSCITSRHQPPPPILSAPYWSRADVLIHAILVITTL